MGRGAREARKAHDQEEKKDLLQYNVSLHSSDYFPYGLCLFVPTLWKFSGCHTPQFSIKCSEDTILPDVI